MYKGLGIEFITIATTGNSSDFGDGLITRGDGVCAANQTNCLIGGSGGSNTSLAYVVISTLGNAVDFGDLPHPSQSTGAISNAHGGLS